jgi:hypothetical protein
MKTFLFNQFDLNNIDSFSLDKCTDTMAFLRFVLKRAETKEEKTDIQNYIARITERCNQLSELKAA